MGMVVCILKCACSSNGAQASICCIQQQLQSRNGLLVISAPPAWHQPGPAWMLRPTYSHLTMPDDNWFESKSAGAYGQPRMLQQPLVPQSHCRSSDLPVNLGQSSDTNSTPFVLEVAQAWGVCCICDRCQHGLHTVPCMWGREGRASLWHCCSWQRMLLDKQHLVTSRQQHLSVSGPGGHGIRHLIILLLLQWCLFCCGLCGYAHCPVYKAPIVILDIFC